MARFAARAPPGHEDASPFTNLTRFSSPLSHLALPLLFSTTTFSRSYNHHPKTKMVLAGLESTLKIAESVLDGFPIPAAKFVINGVLKFIDNVKTSCSNQETLNKLNEHMTALVTLVLEPLSGKDEKDIPHELRDQVDKFVNELDSLARWVEPHTSILKQLFFAKEDEKELTEFSESVRRAVAQFDERAD
ncbi:hypothetical protein SCHPADRAFT_246717 [Schizopora paradoxa]|uniref:Uncharacterized protein n=1 Tax=Schizopora paradoxa TaxID=27342 RepID=A0A0H2SF66_9AGAM|nr:hypothetical protein SCHPADRAFT_246717 [Schizopora paradoxa]